MKLPIQKSLSLRAMKKIILRKTEFRETWIRFLLNEEIYIDDSKVFELQQNVELINVILFRVESQLTTFRYSGSEFCLVLNNDRNIGDVETELRYKAGLGSDYSFYGFGNRKLQKGEMLYEHHVITLKRMDERADLGECKIVDITLNAFIGNMNSRTNIKCFDGGNRRGLGNHIGKVFSFKK
jgi:hypothetical protein